MLLLTVCAGLGLAMAGRLVRRAKPALVALHEHLALSALAAIGLHGVTLLGDRWLHPSLREIALPFALGYRPAFTGVGVVAGYLVAALALSFYIRRRIGVRLWRRLHRLTLVAYAATVVHTLGSGTDAAAPWLVVPLLASAAAIASLLLLRLRRRRLAVRPA